MEVMLEQLLPRQLKMIQIGLLMALNHGLQMLMKLKLQFYLLLLIKQKNIKVLVHFWSKEKLQVKN